jgi:hypothetical protein
MQEQRPGSAANVNNTGRFFPVKEFPLKGVKTRIRKGKAL